MSVIDPFHGTISGTKGPSKILKGLKGPNKNIAKIHDWEYRGPEKKGRIRMMARIAYLSLCRFLFNLSERFQ